MIAYISSATNDFLTDVPLAYNIADLTVPPTQQNTPLPADSLFPVRVAYESYPLRETSQSNLDSMAPQWSQQGLTIAEGLLPRQDPDSERRHLAEDGEHRTTLKLSTHSGRRRRWGGEMDWIVPDPFTVAILQRTLSFAYSKDGECKSPGLAKYLGRTVCHVGKNCKDDSGCRQRSSRHSRRLDVVPLSPITHPVCLNWVVLLPP